MQGTRTDIEFGFGNGTERIDFAAEAHLSPTTTLLQYLRGRSDRKGTKEGCAEGDCGACTVVLGEPDGNGGMSYQACDSCLIFLPQIHGKQLITVESIGKSTALHPVQEAMVETGGSQCGYCTPGFIMSLFALYKQGPNPSRDEIDDALTGNLCRCTGYRPIVEAAAQSCAKGPHDPIAEFAPAMAKILQNLAQNSSTFEIRREDQVYFRPQNLTEALRLRQQHPTALLVNGSTDIGLLVTKQKRVLPVVIDLSGVQELKKVESATETLKIGAGVSLEKVRKLSEKKFPALNDMLNVFGSRQIRNLATLGGNVGTASPIGDTPPVLMALDAEVELVNLSENGVQSLQRRRLKVADFIDGYRSTVLAGNELIESFILHKNQPGITVKSYKISKRKDLDISTVSGGFRLGLDEKGRVKEIRLYYGGMAATTKRAEAAEDFLQGKEWSRANVEAAMDLVESAFTPISDARAGKEGRRVMARNLLLKFWSETVPQTV
ncbi:MAG: xanthine dehydrogenase small subunit [Bacteroidia bacterium]|nr:xanthine dehydrogenase small subunit [Bacteroidia bacterium]